MTITSIFQQVFGFTTSKRSAGKSAPIASTATQEAWTQAMSDAEEHRVFMASIAGLPTDEKQQRIARCEWYHHLAERQGVVEAEQQANNYWK